MRETRPDPPELDSLPVCPVCGEECETVYTDINSEVCGCENCVNGHDSREYCDVDEDPDPDRERGWACRDD